MDAVFGEAAPPEELEACLIEKIGQILSRTVVPKANRQGNIDFQISRGHTGISL